MVRRIPDLPDVFAQVRHKAGGGYTLEHRGGAADRHFEATTDRPEAVITALTGWARQEAGWDAGLAWSLMDMGPVREVPPLDLDEDEREVLEKRVREVLVAGYASRADLAEYYLVTEDRRPVSREQAGALADRMWLEETVTITARLVTTIAAPLDPASAEACASAHDHEQPDGSREQEPQGVSGHAFPHDLHDQRHVIIRLWRRSRDVLCLTRRGEQGQSCNSVGM